jgi:hypothetical protein
MSRLTFTASMEEFDFKIWNFHIPVPDDIASKMMDGNNRRVLVWIQNAGPFQMALMKVKSYWYLILNQEIKKKLGLEMGSSIEVIIEKDRSEFGHEVPEEFQVLLDQDEEGNTYFRSLTMGKQRSLIYLVTKVKNSESRMKKSLAILHHLKSAKGNLDFKQLHEWIKYYNNL